MQDAAEVAATDPLAWLDDDVPPRWIAENPYFNGEVRTYQTYWQQLTPQSQALIQTARRELCTN